MCLLTSSPTKFREPADRWRAIDDGGRGESEEKADRQVCPTVVEVNLVKNADLFATLTTLTTGVGCSGGNDDRGWRIRNTRIEDGWWRMAKT